MLNALDYKQALLVYDWLCFQKPLNEMQVTPFVPVIVGFGSFDVDVPSKCGKLYEELAYTHSPRIIFTGARGAGSGNIVGTEAEHYLQVLDSAFTIPREHIFLETQAPHTVANVINILPVLRQIENETGLPTVAILVASPYRSRRVALTWTKHAGRRSFFSIPPTSTFAAEVQKYASQGINFLAALGHEVDIIKRHSAPKPGLISRIEIPEDVMFAAVRLQKL